MGTPPRIATPRCGLEQRWAGALAWPQAAAPGARGLAAGPHLAQCLSAARHALERPRHLGPPAPTAYRLSQTCAALGPPRCVATKAHRAGGAVAAGPPAPPAWRRVSTGMRAGGSQRREGRRTTHGGKSLWQGLECARDGTMRPMLQSANHGTTRQQLGDVGRNTASHRADSVASCFQRRQQQESLGTPVTTGTAVSRTCRCRPNRGATCARLGGPRVPVLRRRNAPRWPVTSPGTAGSTGPVSLHAEAPPHRGDQHVANGDGGPVGPCGASAANHPRRDPLRVLEHRHVGTDVASMTAAASPAPGTTRQPVQPHVVPPCPPCPRESARISHTRVARPSVPDAWAHVPNARQLRIAQHRPKPCQPPPDPSRRKNAASLGGCGPLVP